MEKCDISWKKGKRALLHGGNAVLTVSYPVCEGESALAAHVRELVQALCGYAEEFLLPRAAAELEELLTKGELARFRGWRYTISLEITPITGCISACLSTRLARGAAGEEESRLSMYWRSDGSCQLAAPPQRSRGKKKRGGRTPSEGRRSRRLHLAGDTARVGTRKI
ncbi:MAG: hypothetical protein E7663_06205 [Ruminococcaceae bacterium]|nr:hypothetical protein [Oscillospiraceae bacterium]